jgi:hypothetical protein
MQCKVLKAVHNVFTELCARFDSLEANLRETLRKTSTDMKANTTELESLSAKIRELRPGLNPCISLSGKHHEAKREAEPDLLRRLKRGYLLQYETDDKDDVDDERFPSRSINSINKIKREVRWLLARTSTLSHTFVWYSYLSL